MRKPIRIDPNPKPILRRAYPLLHALSFLISGAAVCLWILSAIDSFAPGAGTFTVKLAGYYGLAIASLVFSCAAIMSRTGARWAHVSFFLFILPLCSIMIPIAGTAVCAYCLSKVARPVLPELALGGHRQVRSGARPPSGNARVYPAVPLYKSGASGIFMLSFIMATHLFYLLKFVSGLIVPGL
jgi:hypothetical protein